MALPAFGRELGQAPPAPPDRRSVKPFRRSSRFGVIGVLAVMAATAVIGLTMGQDEPKRALAIIFGVLAAYMVVLFFLQLRDVSAAGAADTSGSAPEPGAIENPATLDEPTLFAAMATRPIDARAVRARRQAWGMARGSINLGMLITALIFVSVPPIYLFDTFVPFMIGAPAIALIAVWKSVRLLARGGDVDRADEHAGRAMAPLGLELVERPDVVIEPKGVAPFRMGAGMRGALVMEGRRHGRRVAVRMPTTGGVRSRSEVLVELESPVFEFKARDGRLKAADGAPKPVADLLRAVPNSTRWNGVRGEAGPGGVSVERKGGGQGDWLLDLWLAERLANAVG